MLLSHQVRGAAERPLQPWLFQVEPHPEESFGHFLGRFRRANHLSSSHLSAMLKQRPYAVSYWETPSRRRQPDSSALQHLSQLTGVAVERFNSMRLPPSRKLYWPTRLCADCYAESPYHRLSWQIADHSHCEIHKRQLLEMCPECRKTFQLPSYWQSGECERCYFPFQAMRAAQRPDKG